MVAHPARSPHSISTGMSMGEAHPAPAGVQVPWGMMRGRGRAGLFIVALVAWSTALAGPAVASPPSKPVSGLVRGALGTGRAPGTTAKLPTARPATAQVPAATSYVLVDVGTGNVL